MARAGKAALAGRKGPAYILAIAVAVLTVLAFLPAVNYPFLNWDDQDIFIRNEALRAPGVIRWAFVTRYMEHYQPISWLAWAGIDRLLGLMPRVAHGLNLALHATCAALVYVLSWRLTGSTVAAAFGALVWAIHPLRVEPVVWASAMPYPLALLLALAATFAWTNQHVWAAAALFAASLLARPLALAAPLVFWIVRRPATTGERAALGVMSVAAVASAAIESSARLTASLAEFGIGARATLAAAGPWRYLQRTLAPSNLTPIDPLALSPRADALVMVLGLAGIALVSTAAWRWRREHPLLSGAWASYLLLLLPALGFLPSGLQATADRYAYVPAVSLSIALTYALTVAEARDRRGIAHGAKTVALATIAILALLTWQQTAYWHDSITLWTRAVEIDPRNDVALYNLGSVLGEAGRRTEAIERYEQVLAIVPDHIAARRNRDLLEAERLEEEANELASRGKLEAATERYARAIRLDPKRTHSQAALGMALTELGRYDEARQYLQAAVDRGAEDPAVVNALAYVLARAGEDEQALALLRDAQRRHPNDANIRRNLAILEGRRR